MTGQGPGFAGQNTSLVGQKRKKGRESDRPGQALARQNPKFVGRLTNDWLLFAGLLSELYHLQILNVKIANLEQPSEPS